MNKSKSILASVSLALSLSGCMGVYEGGFDCPPGVGVGCKSISEVNTMVNRGFLPKKDIEVSPEHSSEEANSCKSCSSPNFSHKKLGDLLIWWAPQWERKTLPQPINIVPTKG